MKPFHLVELTKTRVSSSVPALGSWKTSCHDQGRPVGSLVRNQASALSRSLDPRVSVRTSTPFRFSAEKTAFRSCWQKSEYRDGFEPLQVRPPSVARTSSRSCNARSAATLWFEAGEDSSGSCLPVLAFRNAGGHALV